MLEKQRRTRKWRSSMYPRIGVSGLVGQQRTYLDQLSADTGYNLEDLPGAIDDGDGWAESVQETHSISSTWWWSYMNPVDNLLST